DGPDRPAHREYRDLHPRRPARAGAGGRAGRNPHRGTRARRRISPGGRAHRQFKRAGHRMEREEIEAALLRLPDIGDAVVVVEGEASDARRLVAYVAPAPGASPRSVEVRDALRRSLPSFMVPAMVVVLAALPLTPN